MTAQNPTPNDDASVRFSLLSSDNEPRAPKAEPAPELPPVETPAAETFVYYCHNPRCRTRGQNFEITAGQRRAAAGKVLCRTCGKTQTAQRTAPAEQEASEIPDGFETIAAEGAQLARQAGKVRGNLNPEDVNAVIGYTRSDIVAPGVTAGVAEGTAATYANAPTPAAAGQLAVAVDAVVQQTAVVVPIAARPLSRAVEPAPLIRHGDLVAGAVAEGFGRVMSWEGRGEKTLAETGAILAKCGLAADLNVAARSVGTYLNRAVRTLRSAGVRVEHERPERGAASEWKDRWVAVRKRDDAGAAIGDTYGTRVLHVELKNDDSFVFHGDAGLEQQVRDEYDRLTGAQVIKSSEVTGWLRKLLKRQWKAVALGGNWYVPREHADPAEKFLTAVKESNWGREWFLPALPVATCGQLMVGLTAGLRKEVAEISEEVTKAKAEATAAGKEDLGARMAANFCARLDGIADRVRYYGATIGVEYVSQIREDVHALLARLKSAASDAAMRAALIWDEIETFGDAPTADVERDNEEWRRRD